MQKNVASSAIAASTVLIGVLWLFFGEEPQTAPPPVVASDAVPSSSTTFNGPISPQTFTTRPSEVIDAPSSPSSETREPQLRGKLDCRPTASGGLDCGSCETTADCPDEHACGVNLTTMRRECMPSNCQTSTDCPSGERCLALTATSDGAGVTRCAPIGKRELNQTCSIGRRVFDSACGAGLVCHAGLCRQACRLGAGDCADGAACIPTPDGAACERVDCPEGCPEGKHCNNGRCTTGPDCTKGDVCPTGKRCYVSGYGDVWVSRCVTPCEDHGQCADDERCEMRACAKACTPGQSSCPEGEHCSGAGDVYVCRPDTH